MEAAQTWLEKNSPPHTEMLGWIIPNLQRQLTDISEVVSRLRKQKKHHQQQQAQQFVATAREYLAHDQFELALQHCEQALALHKDCIEAHWLSGAIWQRQEQWDKATACFKQVTRLNPHYQGITADFSKVQGKLKSEQQRKEHEQWLKEQAPHALTEAIITGLTKGVAGNTELNLPNPLQGLSEEGAVLDTLVVQQLQKALLRLLTTSQLLNRHFKTEYQPIVIYKVVEYLFVLFPGMDLQPGLFSKRPPRTGALEFKPSVSQRDIDKAITQGIASARHHIDSYSRQQELRPQTLPDVQRRTLSTLFAQPAVQPLDLPASETVLINTVFGRPLEFATALVAIMRSKDQKHAFLVMMRLGEYDSVEMHSYHFQEHPTDKRYGLVNIGEAKLTLSQNDTEQSRINEQNQVLRDKRFTNSEAEFPLDHCHYQVFSLSRAQAIQLHLNVTSDYDKSRKKQMPYCKLGNKALANHSLSTVPGHNCYTWAREKLADIGKKLQTSWMDYLVADPSYYLTDQKCRLM